MFFYVFKPQKFGEFEKITRARFNHRFKVDIFQCLLRYTIFRTNDYYNNIYI